MNNDQVDLPRDKKAAEVRRLRALVQAWMFAMMTTTSRTELLHLLKIMRSEPKLAKFKERIEYQQGLIRTLKKFLSEKQLGVCCKPFFYQLTFVVDGDQTFIEIPISSADPVRKEVTNKVIDVKDWNAYQNLIADLLNGPDLEQNRHLEQAAAVEADVALDALNQCKEYLEEKKKSENEKKSKKEKMESAEDNADLVGIDEFHQQPKVDWEADLDELYGMYVQDCTRTGGYVDKVKGQFASDFYTLPEAHQTSLLARLVAVKGKKGKKHPPPTPKTKKEQASEKFAHI